VWHTAKKATEEQSMMRSIIARLKPKAGDDQVTKAAIERLQAAAANGSIDPREVAATVKETAEERPLRTTDQQQQAINAYISSLPEPQRTMILMRHLDGQTYVQIAESLGLGKKSVLKSLARIYSELRLTFQD
jgi:RNA polymerase sigma factor (sigma-70 family)